MAVVNTLSNHFKFMQKTGQIDTENDVFKAILMNNTFAFDKDTDANLSDITADQLATAGGYTQNDETLAGVVETEDDANDRSRTTWTAPSWTGTGAGFGPTGACCIIDETALESTEFFTTEIDRTFLGGSTHWANGDIGTTFDDTGDLSLVASSTGQYCKITFTDIGTALVSGGMYRLTYDYAETTAGYEFKLNGVALQVLGDAVAGTAQTIDFYADEEFATTDELRIYSKTNAAAAGDFDNFSLKELGTVVGCCDYGADFTITVGVDFQINDLIYDLS